MHVILRHPQLFKCVSTLIMQYAHWIRFRIRKAPAKPMFKEELSADGDLSEVKMHLSQRFLLLVLLLLLRAAVVMGRLLM